jgi:uncharacterized integral membrane protein
MALPSENRPASAPDAPELPLPTVPPESATPASIEPTGAPPPAYVESQGETAPPADVEPLGGMPPRAPPVKVAPVKVPRTRMGAIWVGVWAGVAALILLIIFVGQNTASVEINFLWMSGRIPLALALLIAGVCGAIIAMAVAAARIVQLRRHVRRLR